LALDPSLPEAHYQLGNLALKKGLITEAQRHLEQAVKLDAHNGQRILRSPASIGAWAAEERARTGAVLNRSSQPIQDDSASQPMSIPEIDPLMRHNRQLRFMIGFVRYLDFAFFAHAVEPSVDRKTIFTDITQEAAMPGVTSVVKSPDRFLIEHGGGVAFLDFDTDGRQVFFL